MTEYSDEQSSLINSIEWFGDQTPTPVAVEAVQIRSNPIMTFLSRHIRLSNNQEIDRDIVYHVPTTMALIYTCMAGQHQYLITREYRAGIDMVSVGLPAGCIKEGEPSLEAMWRELKEETGVYVSNSIGYQVTYQAETTSSEGMTNELTHLYAIKLGSYDVTAQQLDDDEHIQYAWVNDNELQQLIDTRVIRDARAVQLYQAVKEIDNTDEMHRLLYQKTKLESEVERLKQIVSKLTEERNETREKLKVDEALITTLKGTVRGDKSAEAGRNNQIRLGKSGRGN